MQFTVLLAAFAILEAVGAASIADWKKLNQTLDNRLETVTPLALPCFSRYNGHPSQPDSAECTEVQDNYTDSTYRTEQIAAYVFPQSEICAPIENQQCLLDPNNPEDTAAFTNVSCNQGSIPSYYIQIQDAQDVAKAFEFASTTNTTLAIKNTGHDYNGRSSGAGTLALWTRHLQNLTYHDDFVASGCNSAGVKAITLGAGVNFDTAYTFAHQNNATFVGGSGPSVGASGGWVMTGGHSVLSPAYGLGVDRVLEFEIVTPDGKHRIANACQNEDLFWALRGGGGGTFGVVLSSTQRVEPAKSMSLSYVSIPSNSSAAVSSRFLELQINSTLKWNDEGWGGVRTASAAVAINPLVSLAEAQSSMSELVNFATANGGSAIVSTMSSFYEFYTEYIVPSNSAVGDIRFNYNWLLPSSLLSTAQGRQELHAHLDWLISQGFTPQLLSTTPYLYSGQGNSTLVKPYAYGPANSTSTLPAWRESAVMLIVEAGWDYNAPVADRKAFAKTLVEANDRAKELAPESGAYANEAHPWVDDWQEDFWGDNYAQLTQLKQKYDPNGLLGCWHCVGSESSARAEIVGGRCLGRLI